MEKGVTVSYPALFPQGFILITAVRPQSHEDPEKIKKTIRRNGESPIRSLMMQHFDFVISASLRLCGKCFL
jgi:hypothetical protein